MGSVFWCLLIVILSISINGINGLMSIAEDDYDMVIFVCGAYGGGYGAGLTSYLIAGKSKTQHKRDFHFLSMDVGTSFDCLETAANNGQLDKILYDEGLKSQTAVANTYAETGDAVAKVNTKIGYFRLEQEVGFLVTHAHLDHVSGLLVSSADDKFIGFDAEQLKKKGKMVLATANVKTGLETLFKEPFWPANPWYNFYEVGDGLKSLESLEKGELGDEVYTGYWKQGNSRNRLYVQSRPLTHGSAESTAFFITDGKLSPTEFDPEAKNVVLFFGDTGPDSAEADASKKKMIGVWTVASKYMAMGILKTILIECSYDDPRAPTALYGHLTPKYIAEEISALSDYYAEHNNGGLYEKQDIFKVPITIVIIHTKPTFKQPATGPVSGMAFKADYTKETREAIKEHLDEEFAKVVAVPEALKAKFTGGTDAFNIYKAKKLNERIKVNIVVPDATDILWIGSKKATEVETHSNIHPHHYPQNHAPHKHHPHAPNNNINNNYSPEQTHWILSDAYDAIIFFVIFFVVICFFIGAVFGGSFAYVKDQQRVQVIKQMV